ncbi:MAG: hypothetical protein Q9208_005560 [Pyrenodesmia sp. 3 TL-2023]
MSIFSKIKGAKKAAAEHKQAKALEVPVEKKDTPIPYRHVPTHAATDALTGAPSSWREEDRAAISYQHKRRSMMTRNSSTLSSTIRASNSYTGSDLSSYGMLPGGQAPGHASSSRPSPIRLDTRRSVQRTSQYQPSPLNSNELVELPSSRTYSAPRPLQHGQHLTPMDNAPRTTTRRLGEAPLLDTPPARVLPVQAAAAVTAPENPKKRSWGFMKRNGQAPSIAAH